MTGKTKTEVVVIDQDSQGIQNLKVFCSQDKFEAALAKALPKHLTAERFIAVALTTISRTPELANCTTLSLYGGIIQASQLGLELDGVLGHAYLVPFKNQATLMIGFKGLRALAIRSGQVKAIRSNTVYENDSFDFQEGVPKYFIHHKPTLSARGKFIAAYSIAIFPDGDYQFCILGKEEIEKIREVSQIRESSTWTKWFGEMSKKTAESRLCKQLQQSPEMRTLHMAVNLEEQAIGGVQDLTSLGAQGAIHELGSVEPSVGALTKGSVTASADQSNPHEAANKEELDAARDEKKKRELKEMAQADKKVKAEEKKTKAAEKKIAEAEAELKKLKEKGTEPPAPEPEDPGLGELDASKIPAEVVPEKEPTQDGVITKAQIFDLVKLGENEGWSEMEIRKTVKKQFQVPLEGLTQSQFPAVQRMIMEGELPVGNVPDPGLSPIDRAAEEGGVGGNQETADTLEWGRFFSGI